MNINEILLQSFLTLGIFLTYATIFLMGVLVGERQTEKEQKDGEQIQSKEKISVYGTKFKIME